MGKVKSVVENLNPFAQPEVPDVDTPNLSQEDVGSQEDPGAFDSARERALKAKARKNRKKLIVPLAEGQGAGQGLQVK